MNPKSWMYALDTGCKKLRMRTITCLENDRKAEHICIYIYIYIYIWVEEINQHFCQRKLF
jgi:hypothetical protein